MEKSILGVLPVENSRRRETGVDGSGSCGCMERFGFEFNGISAVCARRVLRFGDIRVSSTARGLSWRWFGDTSKVEAVTG
jgi:hypothetical protein